jgi:hypothetical protein
MNIILSMIEGLYIAILTIPFVLIAIGIGGFFMLLGSILWHDGLGM